MWKVLPLVLLSAALCQAQPAVTPFSPADAVEMARLDANRLGLGAAKHFRYLVLPDLPEKERLEYATVVSGHVNALSRGIDIVRPALVGKRLLRIDLEQSGCPR